MSIYSSSLKYFNLAVNFGMAFSLKNLWFKYKKDYSSVKLLIENQLLDIIEDDFLEYKEETKDDLSSLNAVVESFHSKVHHVWCMWWQGDDNLPELVRLCYESHKKYIKGIPNVEYTLITKDNYQQFVDIPSSILNKVDSGIITLTHFSDIIRILLLEKYGGLWIDMTIYLTKELPLSYFNFEFFSINLSGFDYIPLGEGQYLTGCKWTGFFMSVNRAHTPLFKYLKKTILKYWAQKNVLIDYFIMNRLIAVAYRHDDYTRKLIDKIPCSNEHLYHLKSLLNTKYSTSCLEKLASNTELFKLSYKDYLWKSIDNKPTVYAHLLDKYKL